MYSFILETWERMAPAERAGRPQDRASSCMRPA